MKILIVGPSWVGDMVMAQTLFIILKRQHADAIIDVLAPAWSRALLEHMPEVRKSVEMTVGHGEIGLGKRRVIARELNAEKYDQAIVLPNSLKSALVPWLARIPLRTGWRGEARSWLLNDCRVLNKQAYPLMVERFAALGFREDRPLPDDLPRPALTVDYDQRAAALGRLALDLSSPVLVLCPGAEFGAAKKWPARHYAEVARHWIAQKGQVWLMGSDKDTNDTESIRTLAGIEHQSNCHNLAGKTSLGEAIDLMSCADKVVSNDSGLMHIAAALGIPLVVVYGSTSPEFTPPLARRVEIVSLGLDCSPCFKRECPLGHTDCLNKLEPGQVSEALDSL